MNIIELQERLKDLPEQSLMQEMQNPTGTAPQFLVLGELKRRKRMRDDYQRMQAQNTPTVAEETVAAAGVPQQGIMQMARAMAPKSAIAQNTGVNDMMQREATRAPQPEAMADGGYVRRMAGGTRVRKMQPGGFTRSPTGDLTGDQLLGYQIFLQNMGLADSPESYEKYTRMMAIQKEKGVSPELLNYGLDRPPSPPEAASIGDIDPNLISFMPGAEVGQPVMPQLPAINVPSVDLAPVDFDASTPPPPTARDPESSLDTLARITGEATDVARGMKSPIPDVNFSLPEIPDVNFSLPKVFDGPSGPSAEEELLDINRRLEDPDLSEREREFLENRQAFLQRRVQAGEFPSLVSEWIDRSAAGIRGTIDPLISGGLSYFYPDAAERFAVESDRAQEYFRERADETAGQSAARLADVGIVEQEPEAARAPRRVENQALSFGLPPADLPSAGAGLSFGNITPSAAEIPLSTGREGAAEPTPEFPLGTPVEAPAAAISSAQPNQSGAGSYGSIESRIAKMLADREKSAEADKWLALAQTGLALMASRQPTIGGAIGEAGLAGIGAMQKARSQYDKEVLDLLDMQAGIQRSRAAGARASSSTSGLNSMIDDARQELSALKSEARSYRKVDVDDFGEARLVDLTPKGLRLAIVAAEDRLATLNALRSGSASTAQFDATAQ